MILVNLLMGEGGEAGFKDLVKVAFLLFIFLWVRATLPRYRYDQLMSLGWKLFLPLSLFWIVVTSCVIFWMKGYV